MIIGAHAILYSRDAEADRAFLRDVLELPSVDAGGGWLIFGLPPAELAVHPSDRNGPHELYLLCDDVRAVVRALEEKGLACAPVHAERWGLVTEVTLPGGGRLGIYEPKHRRPRSAPPGGARRGRPSSRRRKTQAARSAPRRSRRARPR